MVDYIKCFNCCRRFTPGTRPDGTPEGVGMSLRDGTLVNVCSSCIDAFARSSEVLDDFLKKVERVENERNNRK